MAYGTQAGVEGLCINLLEGASSFSASTHPTSTMITSWLSSGCSIIESKLSSEGYVVPAGSGTIVYGWLEELNNLFAASKAEMSRLLITLGQGERTRGVLFEKQFWTGLEQLCTMDLGTVGLTYNDSAEIYVGGVSETVKDTYDDDTDRIQPRFKRGAMFGESNVTNDDDE